MRVPWSGLWAPAVEEFLDAADGRPDVAAERYVQRLRRFYDVRARWHRRGYRLSGVVVILVGALLPLLAVSSYGHKDLVVSFAGVTVSVVTAMRSFYRWDQSWILLRTTEIAISEAYLKWKLTVGADAAVDRAAAARELVDTVMRIRHDEADSFFSELPVPQAAPDGHPVVPLPERRREQS